MQTESSNRTWVKSRGKGTCCKGDESHQGKRNIQGTW